MILKDSLKLLEIWKQDGRKERKHPYQEMYWLWDYLKPIARAKSQPYRVGRDTRSDTPPPEHCTEIISETLGRDLVFTNRLIGLYLVG